MEFKEPMPGEPYTIESARRKISILDQQMNTMGAQDAEPGIIKDILSRLEAGEISPDEAVQKAQGTLDSKQDYH